jgi:hypothetical protein
MVGIAQLVSAPDCGSGGRGFESLYPPHFLAHTFSENVYNPFSLLWTVSSAGRAGDS